MSAKASSASKVTKAKEPSPQAENPTLAATAEEPAETPGRVDSGILEGGVSVALLDKAKDVEETGISSPEDYWTPLRPPPSKGEYKDQYGTLSPVPQHDGTECLKTDDTLWTHAEHFKVCTCSAILHSNKHFCSATFAAYVCCGFAARFVMFSLALAVQIDWMPGCNVQYSSSHLLSRPRRADCLVCCM